MENELYDSYTDDGWILFYFEVLKKEGELMKAENNKEIKCFSHEINTKIAGMTRKCR